MEYLLIINLFLFIGSTELLLIGGIALLLFGGKKLPEMMRGLGQGVREFKKGVNETQDDVADNVDNDSQDEETTEKQSLKKCTDKECSHPNSDLKNHD